MPSLDYRVNKIALGPSSVSPTSNVRATVDLEDFTVDPHNFFQITVEVPKTDAEVYTDLQTDIDAQLTALSLQAVDWSK